MSGYDTLATLQAHGIIDLCNGGFHAFVGTVLGKLVKNTQYSTAGATTPYSPTPGFPADFYYATPTGTSTPAAGPGVQPVACGGCGSLPGTSPTWDGSALSPVPTLAGGIPTFASSVIDPPYFTASGGYAVGANGVTVGSSTLPGDWDNGTGPVPDGAFINKADEGAIPYNNGSYQIPYFGAGYSTFNTTGSILINKGANFSPNRQMPSAGMFGSLPTGVIAGNDWQTLLFRPDPDGLKTHPGAQTPPDYLMLDLFNMPIVEPYAISDPFSTAGKINMNYQIVPFSSYMTRSTGIQAVMRGEQILAVAGTRGTSYKASAEPNRRYYLDLSGDTDTTGTKGTLTGFAKRFATGDIFRSASEICSIWLVPLTLAQTYSTMQAYWLNTTATGGMLTGDNARERPYTNFYPRLTTKSNTFTVHMRVQTLKMVKIVDPTYASWVEGSDVITGEYRGSSTIERYLDTSSTTIPDYATLSQPLTAGQAIDNYYKFRVVETKQFTP